MKNNVFALLVYAVLLSIPISGLDIKRASADEVATSDGKNYEGIIINQTPSDIAIKLQDGTVTLGRNKLKYIKKWPKEKNDALKVKWEASSGKNENLAAREEELKYAEQVKYSDKPWEIYEEDAFIAFHRNEGIIRNRLKGRVGDFCKKVAEKLCYDEFKIYDKKDSPIWSLKFKFYSYGNFDSWTKIVKATGGGDPNRILAFTPTAQNRRIFFYELYTNREEVIYHELTHQIYHEFIINAPVPLWWDEGVAQYALLTTQLARDYISNSRFRALSGKHISLSSNVDSLEHNYEDGLSVIYFLIKGKGKDKFKEFNYSLKKGTKFDVALLEVYGFKDVNDLENAWIEYLKKLNVKDITEE